MERTPKNSRSLSIVLNMKILRQIITLTMILRLTQADMNKVYEFIENHQQCKEEKNDGKGESEEDGSSQQQLELKRRIYYDALNTIRDLQ
jgi:hypothetical protein